ncbi:thiamine phosphate synthase [Megasphaera coli]|uniref:thiamine phosphate synthase n=1 Tax=Colibacter massiliensis TaxID=1852379 RepID=UPI00094E0CE5|nr:thiamine phosphate synthase [Colibacter massiliensis]
MTKAEHIQQLRTDPIYAVMGEELSQGRKNRDVAKLLLAAGVRIIQYREKHKTWREKYAEAKDIAAMCRAHGATFIMNDSVDIALACGADGIHVGQDDAPVSIARTLAGEDIFIGISVNTIDEMKAALADDADYVGFGPLFPTESKKDAHEVVSEDAKRFALDFPLPVVTIGGIGLGNIGALYREGFRSFAMISAVVSQTDIAAAVAALRRALKE